MSDLHNQIMNLPCSYEKACEEYELTYDAYKAGHRDARHAAAELVDAATPAAPVAVPASGLTDAAQLLSNIAKDAIPMLRAADFTKTADIMELARVEVESAIAAKGE